MRKLIINCIVFGSVGGYLGVIGHNINTWSFWVVILGLVAIQINNTF